MRQVILALLVISTMLVSPAWAAEMVSIKLGAQLLTPSGTFSGNNAGDSTIDMENNLNLDDSIGVTAEAALALGNWRLSLGYMPIDSSGTGHNQSLTYNGKTFVGDVAGKIDADLFDLGLTYFLLNMDDTPTRLQLGLEVAAKVIDGETSVSGTVPNPTPTIITETVSGTAVIPTLGARGRIALGDFFGVVARAGYMSYSGNRFLDAEAQIEFSPLPLVGLYGGYRILDIELEELDGKLDASFSGPFLGAFVRF